MQLFLKVAKQSKEMFGIKKKINLLLNFDGACRGNPGHSSGGYVLKVLRDGVVANDMRAGYVLEGQRTNNEAEYTGLRIGLLRTLKHLNDNRQECNGCHILVQGDSKLVINHVIGKFRCKAENLQPLLKECLDTINIIKTQHQCKMNFVHVLREHNKEADAMANKLLDEDNDRRAAAAKKLNDIGKKKPTKV